MRFVGLELLFHDDALLKEVGQSRHDNRVEHVDLQEEAIAHMKAVERDSLDKGDSRHELRTVAFLVSPIADCQGMIDGEMKSVDVCTD